MTVNYDIGFIFKVIIWKWVYFCVKRYKIKHNNRLQTWTVLIRRLKCVDFFCFCFLSNIKRIALETEPPNLSRISWSYVKFHIVRIYSTICFNLDNASFVTHRSSHLMETMIRNIVTQGCLLTYNANDVSSSSD